MFCKLREAVDLVINDNKTEQILLDESFMIDQSVVRNKQMNNRC